MRGILNRFKLHTKLMIGFGIVIVFSIILAVMGIMTVRSVQESYAYILSMPVERISHLESVQVEFMTMRYRVANFVMNSGDLEFINGTALPQYEAARNTLDTNLQEYMELNKSDPRRDAETIGKNNGNAQELKNLLTQYDQSVDTILAFSRAGEAAAADGVLKEAIPVTNQINALIGGMITPAYEYIDEVTMRTVHSENMSVLFLVVLSLALVASACVLAFLISNSIAATMKGMGEAAKEIARGDLDVQIDYRVDDEIGKLAASFRDMADSIREQVSATEALADGDLTVGITPRSEKDTMNIALRKMVDNLNGMFGEIAGSTVQVSSGSKEIAAGAQVLAQGATEQAATVQQLSSSIAEMADHTKNNADKADKAAVLANTIKQSAEKGSRQMDHMTQAVKQINEASHSISKVIKTIDDIAFQTNILALNAAVEAARAGQHGKGFAVVADEVRNLAAKSAEAAKDTAALISDSMEKAELGARIADETAVSLGEIVSGIDENSMIVREIAGASKDQSSAITEINLAIDQVAQVIQQNSATAEESAAASEEMNSQAEILQGLVSQFRLRNASGMGGVIPSRPQTGLNTAFSLTAASSGRFGNTAGHINEMPSLSLSMR